MLEHLSKKDKLWRQRALSICKCKDLADEIVNRTYLRIYNYNIPIEKLTDAYVYSAIYNTYILYCKEPKHISIDKFYDIKDQTESSEFSDEDLEILNKANELEWWQKQLLIESYDKSLRQIEKEFNINYVFVQRHTTKAQKQILGEDYRPYQNKRLKNKNNKK